MNLAGSLVAVVVFGLAVLVSVVWLIFPFLVLSKLNTMIRLLSVKPEPVKTSDWRQCTACGGQIYFDLTKGPRNVTCPSCAAETFLAP